MKRVQLRLKADAGEYPFWSVWVRRGWWPFRYWAYLHGTCNEDQARKLYEQVCSYELTYGDHLVIEQQPSSGPGGQS